MSFPFRRGDTHADGEINALNDTLFLLSYGFSNGDRPPCMDAADLDDDGTVNALTDGLYLLDFGFLGGPAPKPPFPQCGVDPTSDLLPETRC